MKNINEREGSNNELDIITECTINGRTFVITTDKKIYEKNKDNNYRECSKDDEETAFLRKYTEPPKSLDIDYGDDR